MYNVCAIVETKRKEHPWEDANIKNERGVIIDHI